MFLDIIRRDTILLYAILIFFIFGFYIIFVKKTKVLSFGRHAVFNLSNRAYKITLSILSIVIISCIITFSFKILYLVYLVNDGIKYETTILNIEQVKKFPIFRGRNTDPTYLKLFCNYYLDGIRYNGIYEIYDKNQKQKYKIGDNVIIIIDPKNANRSIFYY